MTSAQVAEFLGVKVETVYAYVSRGVLTPVKRGRRGGTLFALADVEALRDSGRSRAATPRKGTGAAGVPAMSAGARGQEVRTQITDVRPDQLVYRGHDAIELSRTHTFEQVCSLLWQVEDWQPLGAERLSSLAAFLEHLPAGSTLDRLKHAVLWAGATDPGRHDRRPAAVVRAGARCLEAMVHAVGPRLLNERVMGEEADGAPLARRLAARWGIDQAEDVDVILIVLADHDMAVSTTAARVATSAGADVYSAILAALAAADSPQHMGAPLAAYGWVQSAIADPQAAIDAALRSDAPPPGFGHLVYREIDPRAEAIYDRIAPRLSAGARDGLETVCDELMSRRGWFINVDFSLALWTLTAGLPRSVGSEVFACARTTGWVAHLLEELHEPGMRFRLKGIYTGPR